MVEGDKSRKYIKIWEVTRLRKTKNVFIVENEDNVTELLLEKYGKVSVGIILIQNIRK